MQNVLSGQKNFPKDEDFMQTQEKLYSIEGWFSPASHALFSFFLDYQNENKINGNLGEIGVWHGKSATIICKKVKENQNIFLIPIVVRKLLSELFTSFHGSGISP